MQADLKRTKTVEFRLAFGAFCRALVEKWMMVRLVVHV